MKYTNAKYIAAAVATSGIALASMAGTCFAATTNPATVPIYLNALATPIDFTVESVGSGDQDMHINQTSASSNNATVTSIKITNNIQSAAIVVSGIGAQDLDGGQYELVAYETDFTRYTINSKKYAIAVEGKDSEHFTQYQDLKGGYQPNDTIAAKGNVQYNFTGKVALSSAAVNHVQISNLVVTVSQ